MSESPVETGRLSALTMPAVTVELSPSGEPNATTGSPDVERLRRPSDAGGRSGPSLDEQHGQVVGRAAADDRGVVAVAVLVDDLDRAVVLGGVGHHVVVGDEVTLRCRARSPEPVAPSSCPWYCATICTVLGQHLAGPRPRPSRSRPGSGASEVAPVVLETAGHDAVAVGLRRPALVRRPAQRSGQAADDQGERAHHRPDPPRDPAALLPVADGCGGVRRHRLGAGRRVRRAVPTGGWAGPNAAAVAARASGGGAAAWSAAPTRRRRHRVRGPEARRSAEARQRGGVLLVGGGAPGGRSQPYLRPGRQGHRLRRGQGSAGAAGERRERRSGAASG